MLKLQPIFKEMVWGGKRLQEEYSFDIPSQHTGEAWVVSAHPEGSNFLSDDTLTTFTLNDFYKQNRALFGRGENRVFPLMIKIIDAAKDLSVQVHPNDEYALLHENSYGKNESWYILDCPKNHRIIMGHHASTREELSSKLLGNDIEGLFRTLTINPKECFDVAAGTIHAICENTLIYEVQQNSNVTYRIFDYNRKGLDGLPRELHLKKSIDVANIPSTPNHVTPTHTLIGSSHVYQLVSNDYFIFNKVEVNHEFTIELSPFFIIIGVESGEGSINNEKIKKGDHVIILPHELPLNITGKLDIFVTTPKEKSMI